MPFSSNVGKFVSLRETDPSIYQPLLWMFDLVSPSNLMFIVI